MTPCAPRGEETWDTSQAHQKHPHTRGGTPPQSMKAVSERCYRVILALRADAVASVRFFFFFFFPAILWVCIWLLVWWVRSLRSPSGLPIIWARRSARSTRKKEDGRLDFDRGCLALLQAQCLTTGKKNLEIKHSTHTPSLCTRRTRTRGGRT